MKKKKRNIKKDKYINKMLFIFKMKKVFQVLHKCAQKFLNIYLVLK